MQHLLPLGITIGAIVTGLAVYGYTKSLKRKLRKHVLRKEVVAKYFRER